MQSRTRCTAGQAGVQALPPTDVSVSPCHGLLYSAVAAVCLRRKPRTHGWLPQFSFPIETGGRIEKTSTLSLGSSLAAQLLVPLFGG